MTLIGVPLLVFLTAQTPTASTVAGEYLSGDGLGVNWSLSLRPSGTFRFTWNGCLGLYADVRGRATLDGGTLTLQPGRLPDGEFAADLPLTLQVVRWGSRIYLVPPDKTPKFENAINLAFEPRQQVHGRFLLRKDDWLHPVSGDPQLPEPRLLLRSPIAGHVRRVLPSGGAETDLGPDDGIVPGQELWVVAADGQVAISTVVEVALRSSVVERDEHGIHYEVGFRVLGRASPE